MGNRWGEGNIMRVFLHYFYAHISRTTSVTNCAAAGHSSHVSVVLLFLRIEKKHTQHFQPVGMLEEHDFVYACNGIHAQS